MFRSIVFVFIVTVTLFAGSSAEALAPGAKCYVCVISGSQWDCDLTSGSGGTACGVTSSNCTVSGICAGAPQVFSELNSPPKVVLGEAQIAEIRQIGMVNPRLAGTLYEIMKRGYVRQTTVFWRGSRFGTENLENFLARGDARLEVGPEQPIVHVASFEVTKDGAVLLITPRSGKTADQTFKEIWVNFVTDSEGQLVLDSWFIH